MNGNAQHGLVTGDRGMGKSSLAVAVEQIALGEPAYLALVEQEPDRAWRPLLVASVVAQRGQSVGDVAASLARELSKRRERARGLRVDAVDIDLKVARFKLGPRATSQAEDPAVALVELLEETWDEHSRERSGILLVLDEADRIAGEPGMASFFKVLTELAARRGLTSVALILVGTDGVIDALAEDHLSGPRVFQPIRLTPLSRTEVRDLFDRTLLGTGMKMSSGGGALATDISGGVPFLIQQIGFEAFSHLPDPTGPTIGTAAVRKAVERLGFG